MSDDALIAGAAAPRSRRVIRSVVLLDALWVVAVGVLLVVSSRFALIDIPAQYLRTGDAPLRVWNTGLPLVAIAFAVAGAVSRSTTWVAVATGVLAPPVAFTGSLALSLFLDADSAFADAGLTVSLAAAFVGIVMLIRWFVYHPADVIGDESRPLRSAALAVAAGGLVNLSAIAVSAVVDDREWTGSFAIETTAMSIVAIVVVGAGFLRTRSSMLVAGAAATAQIVAVVVVQIEASEIALDSPLVLRSGVVGLSSMVGALVASAIGWSRHEVDPFVVDAETDDDAGWRWTTPD